MTNESIQVVSVIAEPDYTKVLKAARRSGIPLIVTVIDDFPSKNNVVSSVLNGLREKFTGSAVMLVTMPLTCHEGFAFGFNKVQKEIPSVHFVDGFGRSLNAGPLEGDVALNPKRVTYEASAAYDMAKRRAPTVL